MTALLDQLKRGLAAEIQGHAPQASSKCEKRTTEASVDVLDWISRTALDLIGLGGLGYSFGALKGTHDPYSEAARRLQYVGHPPIRFLVRVLR